MSVNTEKKIKDPLGFIVLQTQLPFTIGSRNEQAILDSYQSEIFCHTMNPLMIKENINSLDQACSVKMTGY